MAWKRVLIEIGMGTEMFHSFDLTSIWQGPPTAQISLVTGGMNFIVAKEDGKARYLKLVTEMKHALALVGDHDVVRDNVKGKPIPVEMLGT